jgi:hypothetical protein
LCEQLLRGICCWHAQGDGAWEPKEKACRKQARQPFAKQPPPLPNSNAADQSSDPASSDNEHQEHDEEDAPSAEVICMNLALALLISPDFCASVCQEMNAGACIC